MTRLNNLLIRPILAEDLAAVKAFCQRTWSDESDYIPHVLDRWVSASDGQVLVAVLDHEPVGMARIVKLSSTEGWWEGLRVNRDYRRLGIATALTEASIDMSRNLGFSTIRTSVKTNNTVMQSYLRKLQFVQIEDYAIYRAAAIPQSDSGLVRLKPREFTRAWTLIEQSNASSNPQFYVPSGARWRVITESALTQLLERQWVWGIACNGEIEGLFIRSEMNNPDGTLWNGLLTGTSLGQSAGLINMRYLAHQLGFSLVGGFFPYSQPCNRLLATAGYQLSDPHAFHLYELQV